MAAKPLRELFNEFLCMSNEEILEKCGNGIPYMMKPPEEKDDNKVSLLGIAEEM